MEVHDRFVYEASLYVIGALTASESAAFEAHLVVCDVCTREVRDFEQVIDALLSVDLDIPPRPEVRRSLLSRVRVDQR